MSKSSNLTRAPSPAERAGTHALAATEPAREAKLASSQLDIWCKSAEFARAFWKRLVNNVGEREAKQIMRIVTGDKQPGPRSTDEANALKCYIYMHIRAWGLDQSDGKLAKRIYESKPYYLCFDSGAVCVVDNEISETSMSDDDDPIVDRRPIDKGLAALKKQVERIRRWTLAEDILPKEYAPRQYYRD